MPPQEGPALSSDAQAYTGTLTPGCHALQNNPVHEQSCGYELNSIYNIPGHFANFFSFIYSY